MAAMRPLPSFFGKQALRNDVAEGFSESGADALLIALRKDADDALDGLGGIDGVQGGQHQVAGFRGFEGDFNGFAIAHFANENDFGSLAQGGAQGQRKGRRIAVELALVNGGLLVAVQKFDGIFDGQDVKGLVFVHLVDDGGERGGFSRSGGAGDQDDAVAEVHDIFELRRKVQLFETGNTIGNHAHDDGVAAALAKDIDAEAGDAGKPIGEIGGAILLQFADRMVVLAHDVVGDEARVIRAQGFQTLELQLDEFAADLDLRSASRARKSGR